MGVIADLIRAGVAPELIEKVHNELVETAQSAAPVTARQARNARYYQARKERLKASESVSQDDDKTAQDAAAASCASNNHASAPVCSNGSSLHSEPELFNPLPSEGPLTARLVPPREPLPPARADEPDDGSDLGKKRRPIDILSDCLSRKTAADVVEHRKKLRKPLTERAAELSAKALVECGDPEAGAAMWIALGWQGFRVDWFRNEQAKSNARAGPPRQPTRGGAAHLLAEALEDRHEQRIQENIGSKTVELLPFVPSERSDDSDRCAGVIAGSFKRIP